MNSSRAFKIISISPLNDFVIFLLGPCEINLYDAQAFVGLP